MKWNEMKMQRKADTENRKINTKSQHCTKPHAHNGCEISQRKNVWDNPETRRRSRWKDIPRSGSLWNNSVLCQFLWLQPNCLQANNTMIDIYIYILLIQPVSRRDRSTMALNSSENALSSVQFIFAQYSWAAQLRKCFWLLLFKQRISRE